MADSHRADRQCHQDESDHDDADASGHHVSTIVRQRLVRDRPNEPSGALTPETPAATLDDIAIVVAYLGALGGPRHAQAVASLRGIVERRSPEERRPSKP
jgi:hypothetical protein